MPDAFAILHQVERNGWFTTAIPGGWRLHRPQTEEEIFMSILPKWLCLTTPLGEEPGIKLHADIAERMVFYRHFLEQNERMFMTKFGLDNETVPVLMAEVGVKAAS